ncbi:MAG: PAS domain-containing protein [Gemmatimonadaceae bacterium]
MSSEIAPLDAALLAFHQSRHAGIIVAPDPPRWTILDVNDAYLRVTRKQREGLVGMPLFDAFPESAETGQEQGSHRVARSLLDAMNGSRVVLPVQRYDLPIDDKPGEYEENYWELSSVPVRNASGDIIGILHEVENVNQHERAERERRELIVELEKRNVELESQRVELELANRELQDSAVELEAQAEELHATAAQLEERTEEAEASRRFAEAAERQLQTVFAQAPAAVGVTVGPEHRFVLANSGYDRLVGRRVRAGQTFREALPEIAAQGYEALLDRVFHTGEPYSAREAYVQVMRDGELEQGWFDFVFQPLVDGDGNVTGVLQQGIDVTDRVRAESMLRESEAQLRSLANSIPTLAWTARADGFIDWYNERWYTYTGTTPEQMEGWGWQSVHDPEVLPKVMEAWTRSIETGEPFEMTFPLRDADGVFRQFLTRVEPVRNTAGSVTRWFGTNTDVEREHAARREAEDANAAKTTFLATMSHELRTPLNVLGGYLDLLMLELRGPLTDAQRTDLERMQRSHRHLMTLINDVLHFAKIDTGQTMFEIAAVDVCEVMKRIEELVSPQFMAKGIACVVETPTPSPIAMADEERVGQILLNLLGNAAKYTASGGRVVASCAREGDQVRVDISDTGLGIPSEKLEAVFDPFVQVGRRLNAPGEGVGLGLAISRTLAEGMHGTLSVTSEVGVGSTFTLRLPAAD